MQKVWYGHHERMAATERNPGAICYGATLSWGDIRTARPIASDQNNHQAAKGQDGETLNGEQVWYMYCTTDPLNDQGVDDSGDPV